MQRMKSERINPFAALAAELSKPAVIPSYKDGWRDSDEIRIEAGLSFGKTQKMLREGIKSGRIEQIEGWASSPTGRPVRYVKYRPKKISTKKPATASR